MADIWLHDIASGATTQVTTNPEYDENPYWSPDSRMVVYQGYIDQQRALLLAPVDASQRPRAVLRQLFYSIGPFTRDGKAVIVSSVGKNGDTDLTLVRLDRPDVREMLSTEPGLQSEPAVSPDGQWLAFTTDRSGRPEIVLARLIDDGKAAQLGDQRLPVSTAGGSEPDWRRDGQEIVYLGLDRFLTAVPITRAGGALTVGKPTPLFRLPIDAGGTAAWARTSDHTKFIVVEAPNADGQTFRVMTGWK